MKRQRRNTIYIAGPMTGLPEFNFPAFHKAAEEWRRVGWNVLNPADSFRGRTDLPYERYMRAAIKLVMQSSAIALLPGWRESKGARMEVLIAVRQGYEFFDARTGEPIDTPVVDVLVQ